ncbi:hypothetical protein MLD38_031512 [Melastoma candidum]|uniref:Uncharacterized protein n=1 Tax=Melastoma candidum TaxID=119954 RepID=A0ACB9MPX5_9MYRT|nr:hypothetical protein MLD38_031512 [Melastoma candidum]
MSIRGEAEMFSWKGQYADPSYAPPQAKRKSRHHKKEFIGWGSRELIAFLKSVGIDTSQVISQQDVSRIITKYVNDNGLINSAKKKRIVCDENLLSLFGKKGILKNKVYDLLGSHYAENHDDSESAEDLPWGSDVNDVSVERKGNLSEGQPKPKRQVVERPKSCFAAVVPDNMKFVYLRKSLVCDLMKDLDLFKGKVVGSFVRTKSDPNDFLQKNHFLLGEVTGLKMASKCTDADTQLLFQEECEDLLRRVKEGLLKRPTVAGFEAKARVLHEDITKNWLTREIAKLDTLIDRANEKGWRRELSEYLDRRKLLQSPEEQSRLLAEMPKVIADERELGSTTTTINPEAAVETKGPPTTSGRTSVTDAERLVQKSNDKAPADFWLPVLAKGPKDWSTIDYNQPKAVSGLDEDGSALTDVDINQTFENSKHEEKPLHQVGECSEHGNDKTGINPPMIDLTCEDEDEEIKLPRSDNQQIDVNDSSMVWHYRDPQGNVQGPFTLELLQCWSEVGYFHKDFKVWMTGQSPSSAVKLTEVLFGQMFSK